MSIIGARPKDGKIFDVWRKRQIGGPINVGAVTATDLIRANNKAAQLYGIDTFATERGEEVQD